jgi:hypothetical protein
MATDFTFRALAPASFETGFVMHVTDPDSFYIQLDRDTAELENLMALLQVC